MSKEVPLISFNHSSLCLKASLVAQTVKNLPAMQETWVLSLGQEDPLDKGMATHSCILGLHRWLSGKEPTCQAEDARDMGSIPGLGRYPGEGNGYLLQYSCLENPMDRAAWRAIVQWVTKNWTRLSD